MILVMPAVEIGFHLGSTVRRKTVDQRIARLGYFEPYYRALGRGDGAVFSCLTEVNLFMCKRMTSLTKSLNAFTQTSSLIFNRLHA
jgi:hypothetical protein